MPAPHASETLYSLERLRDLTLSTSVNLQLDYGPRIQSQTRCCYYLA